MSESSGRSRCKFFFCHAVFCLLFCEAHFLCLLWFSPRTCSQPVLELILFKVGWCMLLCSGFAIKVSLPYVQQYLRIRLWQAMIDSCWLVCVHVRVRWTSHAPNRKRSTAGRPCRPVDPLNTPRRPPLSHPQQFRSNTPSRTTHTRLPQHPLPPLRRCIALRPLDLLPSSTCTASLLGSVGTA